jgi:hypothetical protein
MQQITEECGEGYAWSTTTTNMMLITAHDVLINQF